MNLQQIFSALSLSLLCGVVAILVDVLPAGFIALILARRRFKGKALVEFIVMLPVVLPAVVVGFILLMLFSSQGPLGTALGWFHVNIIFTWAGAVVAQASIALPLLVLTWRVAFEGVDTELEAAAALEGAGHLKTFLAITLPLAWPGLAAGGMLALARALGEFGATVIVAGNIAGQTRTLPLAVVTATRVPGEQDQAMVLALVAAGLAVLVLALYRLFTWKEKAG